MWDTNDKRLLPLLLIGGGIFFLFIAQGGIGVIWPFFIVIPGAIFLYHALTGRSRNDVDMIFPGVIVTATGLILLFQSITGHWESWAYIWAIYPALVGFAMRWRAERVPKYEHELMTGTYMMRYSALALVGLAVLFEFLIFNNGSAQVVGIGLVVLGLIALATTSKRRRETRVDFSELLKPKNDSLKRKVDEEYDEPVEV